MDEEETVTTSAIKALQKAKELKLVTIFNLLRVVCVLPVTSNEAERSFSRLKIVKTSLRATMTNTRLVLYHYFFTESHMVTIAIVS